MIHPSSVISSQVKLGKNVEIGPFCRVDGDVTLGDGCILESHVVIGSPNGEVVIGKNNRFHAGCVVGGPPQDLKYKGEKTKLIMGDENVIREFVTVSLGTVTGHNQTVIGSRNLLMAYCHVGHDAIIGNQNVLANQAQLAGHVTIEDKVTLGGLCAVNQFVRIGSHAFLAGGSMINKDILPYCIAQGNYATVRATNKIGLERSGFNESSISNINRAVRILTKGSTTIEEAVARIADECDKLPEIEYMLSFVRSSERGLGL